jgi:benzoyl-CoA reductase/2-hydroxyglutaryl-CoA dehydratase subunit BcrC/BadD/HgdB
MKTVIYNSSYIPREWIRIHECIPKKVTVISENQLSSEGKCSYASSFMKTMKEQEADAIIITSTCAQMRHSAEQMNDFPPVFLFNMPVTWQAPAAKKQYINELHRLSIFLTGISGQCKEKNLRATMIEYDLIRSELKSLKEKMQAKQFLENIFEFNNKGCIKNNSTANSKHAQHRIRIALTGGPLTNNHLQLFDVFEKNNISVLLNCTENGEWSLGEKFRKKPLLDNPFMELADSYFAIPEIFRRPNNKFYSRLKKEVAEYNIQGLIINRYPWCDLWLAEVERIKNCLNIPVLDLEMDLYNKHDCINDRNIKLENYAQNAQKDIPNKNALVHKQGIEARIMTRIEAFMETLHQQW